MAPGSIGLDFIRPGAHLRQTLRSDEFGDGLPGPTMRCPVCPQAMAEVVHIRMDRTALTPYFKCIIGLLNKKNINQTMTARVS